MAVYVMLAFDDDEGAKTFVKDALDLEGVYTYADPTVVKADVVAVFKKPTQFCSCGKFKAGWTRGQKYGWWVCANCGKPSITFSSADDRFMAVGKNLLPWDLLPDEFKTKPRLKQHVSPLEWSFLLDKEVNDAN